MAKPGNQRKKIFRICLKGIFKDTIREVGRKNGVLVLDLARELPPD